MGRRSATMEWQMVQDDETWRQLVQAAAPADPKLRRLSGRLGEVLLLLLLLCGVALAYSYIKQTARQQMQTELAAVIQPDRAAALPIHLLTLEGNQAIVNTPASGQTRLYQRTATGWQQTMPMAEAWGAPQQWETPSFRWHYHAQDAAVVATVAPQMERLYATLRHNFALPAMPLAEKLTIEVSLASPADQQASPRVTDGRLLVPAPALYRSAANLSDAEVLAQSIALPLINGVITEAQERHQLASTWQPLLQGLRLWQLWDLDLPLATWREPVVQWIYQELPGAVGEAVVLPKDYTNFCATHTLWLSSPMQIGIPLLCTELDEAAWYAAVWGTPSPLTHLNQLTIPDVQAQVTSESPAPERQSPHGQTIALATLIDYAVATYGRERLPVLVTGLGQSESWETLLPAVYGISAIEFEAGWQAYLATHYHRSTS